jgi:hypothetical protein
MCDVIVILGTKKWNDYNTDYRGLPIEESIVWYSISCINWSLELMGVKQLFHTLFNRAITHCGTHIVVTNTTISAIIRKR